MNKKLIAKTKKFDNGEAAVHSGMKVGELFFDGAGKLAKVENTTGEMTRGEFGNVYFSSRAYVWGETDGYEDADGEYHSELGWVEFDPEKDSLESASWKVWDSDFGLL